MGREGGPHFRGKQGEERRMKATWLLAAAFALVPSCVLAASARLIDASGRQVGQAELTQLPHGVLIRLETKGLPPGWHGVHVHRVGVCEGPDFRSADIHFDPLNKRHGHGAEAGPHAGDLPNLYVAANGEGEAEFLSDNFTLGGGGELDILDADGAALVIHAHPDDHRSHPSGESGERIACGEIRK
jgi:Cu-Zn family superoxide dismutase